MAGMRRSTAAAVVLVLALTGALAACSAEESTEQSTTSAVAESREFSTPLSEFEVVEAALAPGDELRVLVDTPGTSWAASSSDADVLEIDDPGTGDESRVVTITAVTAGTASIVFTGDGADEEYEVSRELEVTE